jgi:hypothetical protein
MDDTEQAEVTEQTLDFMRANRDIIKLISDRAMDFYLAGDGDSLLLLAGLLAKFIHEIGNIPVVPMPDKHDKN